MPLEAIRQIRVEEYYKMGEIGIFALDERVELIDGIVWLGDPCTVVTLLGMTLSKIKAATSEGGGVGLTESRNDIPNK